MDVLIDNGLANNGRLVERVNGLFNPNCSGRWSVALPGQMILPAYTRGSTLAWRSPVAQAICNR